MSSPNDSPLSTGVAQKTTSALFGCQGLTISVEEKAFFQDVQPFGFILFARNIETPDQVRELVSSLRDIVGRNDAPVLIDQEGGRVQRLRPPFWRQASSALHLAQLGGEKAKEAIYLNSRLIGRELAELGVTVDCAPVADVAFPETHQVIGDRAYSHDPECVATLCQVVCDALRAEGVHPVIKHIPGHGRSRCDSHLELPHVIASLEELETTDFVPFKRLADEDWAMTAHIVYDCIDSTAPATCSMPMVRDIIRKKIGFSGLLMSDDLSMKALEGSFADRTRAALNAGCDMVLHCNGDMKEMREISEALTPLANDVWQRFAFSENRRKQAFASAPDLGTADEIAERLFALMG